VRRLEDGSPATEGKKTVKANLRIRDMAKNNPVVHSIVPPLLGNFGQMQNANSQDSFRVSPLWMKSRMA
jgi:hypothetical protein